MKRKQSLLEGMDWKLVVTGMVCLLVYSALTRPAQAQGVIWYSIHNPGAVVGHVYGPEVGDPALSKTGNIATETPAGTQRYTGPRLQGSGWSAQLFSALGSGQPETSLVPVATSLTTFDTGALYGGTIVPSVQIIPNVPALQVGTFQLRVWDNQGGLISSWSVAEPAWLAGSLAAGRSALFELRPDPTFLVTTTMDGFRSFNVHFVPEPSAAALAMVGGVALLVHLRRRRRPPPLGTDGW